MSMRPSSPTSTDFSLSDVSGLDCNCRSREEIKPAQISSAVRLPTLFAPAQQRRISSTEGSPCRHSELSAFRTPNRAKTRRILQTSSICTLSRIREQLLLIVEAITWFFLCLVHLLMGWASCTNNISILKESTWKILITYFQAIEWVQHIPLLSGI